jgi:hypothetical protein
MVKGDNYKVQHILLTCTIFQVLKVWSNLNELDISFNTITDVGTSSLATMFRLCPDLQMLNIESCALGPNAFHQHSTFIEAIQGSFFCMAEATHQFTAQHTIPYYVILYHCSAIFQV